MASRPVSNSLFEDHQRRLNGLERANREKMRTVSIPTYDLTKLPDDLGDGTVFHSTTDTLCVMAGGVPVCTPSSAPTSSGLTPTTIFQHLPLYKDGYDEDLLTNTYVADSACFQAGYSTYSSTTNDTLGWDVHLGGQQPGLGEGPLTFSHNRLILVANHGPAISNLGMDIYKYGGAAGNISGPVNPMFTLADVTYGQNFFHPYDIFLTGAVGDDFTTWTGDAISGELNGGPGRYSIRIYGNAGPLSASYFELQKVMLVNVMA